MMGICPECGRPFKRVVLNAQHEGEPPMDHYIHEERDIFWMQIPTTDILEACWHENDL